MAPTTAAFAPAALNLDTLHVVVAGDQPYAWHLTDDRLGPTLNRAASQVLDQDHPASHNPNTDLCTTCGHDTALRSDRPGVHHATRTAAAEVLAQIVAGADHGLGWKARAARGWDLSTL